MKDILYKICLLFILSIAWHGNAQEEVSKTIENTYEFTNAGELQLENKYGNVVINGWDQNKIQITTDITVSKNEKKEAKNLMDRIKPSVTIAGNYINVFSNVEEENHGFFSKLLNSVNPFDLDKGNIRIDYTIYLPMNAEVSIVNRFGDITLSDWDGKLKADLQHGNLWINNDLANAKIKVKYGALKARSITYGKVNLKNSEFDLETSKDLKIESSGSTINITSVANLEIYASKDKITIQNLERIQGELEFSNMKLENVIEDINLTLDVADLRINKIAKPNPTVIIKQKSSELNINITGINIEFYASLEQGLLRIPTSFTNVKTNIIDSRTKLRDVYATYGIGEKGKIQITGKKGVILLKEK